MIKYIYWLIFRKRVHYVDLTKTDNKRGVPRMKNPPPPPKCFKRHKRPEIDD
jgi:hypothetical protein